MTGTAARSLTGTMLATMPAAPSGTRLLTRPSSSSAPTDAATPESQLERIIQYGAWPSRSRSCTVSGPSSSWIDENKGLSARKVPCAAMCASQAPSRACSTSPAVALP